MASPVGAIVSINQCNNLPRIDTQQIQDLINQCNQLSRDQRNNQQSSQNAAKQANQLNNDISNISNNITRLGQQIDDTQKKISDTQKGIDDLTQQIVGQEDELARQQKNQNETLRVIYETTGQQSDISLLTSQPISAAIDQAAYLEALDVQIESNMDSITKIKNGLSQKKADATQKQQELLSLQKDLDVSKKSSEQQKSQKDQLLNMTLDQKRQYDAAVKNLQSEISNISDQIYALRQKALQSNKEGLSSGGSGYPYSSIDQLDAWEFATSECTSYAAYYWNVLLGKKFINSRPGNGDAWNWPALARDQGYSVSSTPHVGAIISWSSGSLTSQWGHVAIVEGINNDGTINISEYNWIKYSFDRRTKVNPSNYGSFSYIY